MSNQVFAGSKIDKLAKAIKSEKLSSPRITSNDPMNNNNMADRDLLLQSNVAIIQELIKNWRTLQENNATTNELGKVIPSNWVTHDLTFPGPISGVSINPRTQMEQLEPFYYGHMLNRMIHQMVAYRAKFEISIVSHCVTKS
jgi:hypothetical protein